MAHWVRVSPELTWEVLSGDYQPGYEWRMRWSVSRADLASGATRSSCERGGRKQSGGGESVKAMARARPPLARRIAIGGVVLTLLLIFAPAGSAGPEETPAPEAVRPPAYDIYFGNIHNHTAYSDGEGRPEDAFAAGKASGVNFFFLTEHSEWLEFPVQADEDCLLEPQTLPDCFAPPPLGTTEWQDIKDQGEAASDPAIPYLGLRGFEWSSPTLGHLNVLLSENYSGLGPEAPTMDVFWRWFLLDAGLGGGDDGLGIFNHPSRETHPVSSLQTFEDFRYVPQADPRMIGAEIFNRGNDWSACFVRALDKGWHLGAIGAADSHDNWGRLDRSVTALLLPAGTPLSQESIRETLLARRFYATFDRTLILSVEAYGQSGAAPQPMGSRLVIDPSTAPEGLLKPTKILVRALDPDHGDLISRIELYGSDTPTPICDDSSGQITLQAQPVAAQDVNAQSGKLSFLLSPAAGESWFFAKVIEMDGDVAYTSPVWVNIGPRPLATRPM